jgi:hypothetical protein
MVPARPPAAPPHAAESTPAAVPPAPAPSQPPEPAPEAATVEPPKKDPAPAPAVSAWRASPDPQYAGVPAPSVRERHGMVILPYVGVHSFQGSNGSGLNPGLRVGAFVGRYVKRIWSLNGQAELDVLNPNDTASSAGVDASAQMIGVTFSPLVHLGNGKTELVAGPKLGGWIQRKHLAAGTTSVDATLEGWTVGANAGVFTAASPSKRFGGMLSLEVRDILHACRSQTGIPESCSSSGASATIVGFTVGLLL